MAPIVPNNIYAKIWSSKDYFNRELKDILMPDVKAGTSYLVMADGESIDMVLTSYMYENPFCPAFREAIGLEVAGHCEAITSKVKYHLFMDGNTPKYEVNICDDLGSHPISGRLDCGKIGSKSGEVTPHMIYETGMFLLAMIKSGESAETVEPIWDFLMACKETVG